MDNIYPVSQRDSKWRSILLGFNTGSTYTIGSYGCLITCISCVINHFKKKIEENPQTINTKLKDVKGFVGGGLYVWGSICKIYPELKETVVNTPQKLTDKQMKLLTDSLDANNPVMLEVDFNPQTAPTDMHYVLAIDWNKNDENDITIMDPWDGEVKSLKSYLGLYRTSARESIEQMVFYTFSSENTSTGQVATLEGIIKTLTEELEAMRISRNEWKKTATTQKAEIKSLSEQLKEANTARTQLTESLGKLEYQVLVLENALTTNKTPLNRYTTHELFVDIWRRIRGDKNEI